MHKEETSAKNYLKSNYGVILHIELIMKKMCVVRVRGSERVSVSIIGAAAATVFVLNEYLTR